MAVSSPHLQESGVRFSASFSHGRFTKLVNQSGLNWLPSYRAYMIFYSWLKSFTPIMQQGHLMVLLLKIRAPAVFSICVLCLGGSQDPSYVLCRATTARKAMLLPPQTLWWSSIRMHPNHSDHPFLPQVIAVSCDNSEVPAGTRKAYTERKNAFFFRQTGYLTRLTTQIIQYQCQLKTWHRTTLNLPKLSKYETILTGNIPQILIHPATGASLSSQITMFITLFTFERLTLGF